jgi:protein-tyrosine phosphatase
VAQILFLCTGNLCRSPSAAWFFSQRVIQYGPGDLTVDSAGVMGANDGPPERLLKEGAAFGMDLSDHVPRKLDADDIARSDLIVGMAREHVREVVVRDPASLYKVYTLRELVRRGQESGKRGGREPMAEWLAKLNSGRRHADLLGSSPDDDISDPMGRPSEDFLIMLLQVASLTKALHTLAWP